MRARAGWLIVGIAAVLLTAASPAAADDEGGAHIEDGNPTAVAHDDDLLPGGGGGGGDDDCQWNVVIEDDFEFAIYEVNGTRLYSETGRWIERVCGGEIVAVGDLFIIPEGGPADPVQLAADARESVPIATPAIHTSPEANRRLYVRVPTWLWVDPTWWQTYTATANAGRVSSTVTARPVRATWGTGDGGGTACAGPGIEWRRGMRDDATYCKHTYEHSSAGQPEGTYTLTVTVEFEVTWTSNVGAGGSLAAVSRSASRPVEVGEIQAVESG